MRILCLDDEPLALRMLEQAVRQSRPNADISAFLDQDDLLEETKRGGCDIALLDIHMRGMNGVELAKKLKECMKHKEELTKRIIYLFIEV